MSVSGKSVNENIRLTGVYRAGECTCNTWDKHAEQTESGCNSISYVTSLHEGLSVIFLLDYLVKNIESKQRKSYLEYGKSHGNRPELVVERRIVEPELREPHEMASPCEQDSDYSCNDYPPFFTSLDKTKSQYEKENGYCSHVHRTGCERLRTPI